MSGNSTDQAIRAYQVCVSSKQTVLLNSKVVITHPLLCVRAITAEQTTHHFERLGSVLCC
jgi:hypothetical protein